MNIEIFLGLQEAHFTQVGKEDSRRQKKIYSLLVVFEFLLATLSGLAAFTFTSTIFHSIFIGLVVAVAFSLIVFNLINLVLLATLNPLDDFLYKNWINKKYSIKDLDDEKIASLKTNAEVDSFLFDLKKNIRAHSEVFIPRKASFIFVFLRNLLLIFILGLIGLIVANGLELFLFRNQINETIKELLASQTILDAWVRQNLLEPEQGTEFILINSNSLLLNLELLSKGLGNWKWFLDFLVIFLFLLPYIIMYRSPEILKGIYQRELVLHQIEISNRHYIRTRQKIMETKEIFDSPEFLDSLYEKLYGFPKP